ncbi:MAG: sugar ABC transporter permease [Anaerolineae bacterium]|nr:sugar ABC transporter permease [Anaerolineae bacterium]
MTAQSVQTPAPGASSAISRRRSSPLWRALWKHRIDYLLISPFFIIFGIFHGYPLVWSLWLSFQKWQGVGEPRWFGWGNYERLLNSDRIWNAFGNSLIFLVVLLPIIVGLTLILSVILNSQFVKGRHVFRVLFFLPYITSAVIVAIVFQLLLQDNFGWINGILEAIGLPRVGWLTQAWPARIAVMMMVFWSVAGYNILIMLGGLQGIPLELYDAASVDGANTLQKFLFVTVPMMRGVILFVGITSTIGLLNLFAQPWLLFSSTQGLGPDQSVATLNTIQYSTAFQSSRYGEATALGFIIAVLVITASAIQLWVTRKADQ